MCRTGFVHLLLGLLLVGPPVAAQLTRLPDAQAVAWAHQGWAALEAGRPAEGLERFEAAAARDPLVATHFLGAGVALHQLGRAADARARLEEALRLETRLTPASALLGIVLRRLGDQAAAIAVYEAALARAPGDRQMAARLESWKKEAALEHSFRQSMSTNFTVFFEGPAEEVLAARALELLEAAYWRIGGALGVYPAEVISVVLYTTEQFRDVTRSPAWAGGLYDGKIRVPVGGALEHPDELRRVLAHELTHAFVRSLSVRGVPQWLNEGLAGVFEQTDLAWAEEIVREARSLVPLEQLHGDFGGLSPGAAAVAYAESALAARSLLDQAGAAPVVALLTDLGNRVAFADAFSQRILLPYRDFQGAWLAQLRDRQER